VSRRLLAIGLLAIVGVGAIYFFLVRDTVVTATFVVPDVAATIGEGEDAVAVTANGAIVSWWPLPDEPELPRLPLTEVPKVGRLAGPMLEQARVLGAAPAALRPYLDSSRYGESGVDIETTAGIELRFGDATQAELKWKAAAAILADPEIEALDYVNVIAPARSTYAGSGHTLPPAP
jgi:hypothetical protein